MPLAFESLNQGSVAFGFFNIESDMLLLENSFFFADDFCELLAGAAAGKDGEAYDDSRTGYMIHDPAGIGDLAGAIHGMSHEGFIGELYRRFPFPEDPEAFRQKLEGLAGRELVISLIGKYGGEVEIPFHIDADGKEVRIGGLRFDRSVFQEMVRYVWHGGYPRWEYDLTPWYAEEMKKAVARSTHPVYEGMKFY